MQTYSRLRLNKIVNRFREIWQKTEKEKSEQTSYLFYENFSRENTMFLGLGKMILAKKPFFLFLVLEESVGPRKILV